VYGKTHQVDTSTDSSNGVIHRL